MSLMLVLVTLVSLVDSKIPRHAGAIGQKPLNLNAPTDARLAKPRRPTSAAPEVTNGKVKELKANIEKQNRIVNKSAEMDFGASPTGRVKR